MKKWGTLVILSLIWGSSYILIKKGLTGLTPIQLGSLRVIVTTIIIAPIGYQKIKHIPRQKMKWVALSAFVGSFFPAYLFAFAETEISSSITAVMVSLTPLFTLLISVFVFGEELLKKQVFGVLIGFTGIIVLINNELFSSSFNILYIMFIVLAAFCYAINANVLKYKLSNIPALGIVFMSFLFMFIPAFIILCFSDFPFSDFASDPLIIESIIYIVILALFGTAIAKVLYIKLLAISTPVFSVSTTYLMPVVAIFWGLLDGEEFKLTQFTGTAIILLGVYLVTKKKAPK
ncbi:DMT family transporter [Flavobacteriaceae bacterium]|nr:DMT family transporter [Flavobacteriaceae bacterium]MDA9160705.1 DMT family transporter [Flavobacteriaceae bacterium]MDA9882742.1 DMT family transporter [Flavobacteriaceae bacterium]MDC3297629.1 DMT family transporter [Flavobacteriaceae bacterium]